MALYWHPYLAELLRQDYGDRLVIEEEVSLGDMLLRADLLLVLNTYSGCRNCMCNSCGRY